MTEGSAHLMRFTAVRDDDRLACPKSKRFCVPGCSSATAQARWRRRHLQPRSVHLLPSSALVPLQGIENYSRHLARRDAGDPPETLVDYFPKDDWLLIVDESHVSAPQLGAMHAGNLARKIKLVDHGFRLPSALDNRPLKVSPPFRTPPHPMVRRQTRNEHAPPVRPASRTPC